MPRSSWSVRRCPTPTEARLRREEPEWENEPFDVENAIGLYLT
jgi:hypothetical protein